MEKIERALTQRIRAVPSELTDKEHTFKVIGTTDKTYDVLFSSDHVSCTCPDFQMRAQVCKHIYYLVFHYYHIEKAHILTEINGYTLEKFKNKRATHATELDASNCRLDDCTICHDEIDDTREVTICLKGCHKPLHTDCFHIYKEYQARLGRVPTCPSCREVMTYDRMRM